MIESLREARELYVKMGKAAGTLQQAAVATEQDYQRLRGDIHQAASAADRFRDSAQAARQELRSAFSQLIWLFLFASCIGGLVGGSAVLWFSR